MLANFQFSVFQRFNVSTFQRFPFRASQTDVQTFDLPLFDLTVPFGLFHFPIPHFSHFSHFPTFNFPTSPTFRHSTINQSIINQSINYYQQSFVVSLRSFVRSSVSSLSVVSSDLPDFFLTAPPLSLAHRPQDHLPHPPTHSLTHSQSE